jgi:hypothetical protein
MSNLIPNQTEAKSWFIVTNGLMKLDYISIGYFLEVSSIFTSSTNNDSLFTFTAICNTNNNSLTSHHLIDKDSNVVRNNKSVISHR